MSFHPNNLIEQKTPRPPQFNVFSQRKQNVNSILEKTRIEQEFR